MKLATLRRRHEFLRIRGGRRWSSRAFILEGKARPDPGQNASCNSDFSRFGFTVTKKHGNAVTRNRIRRRLRAAVSAVASEHAKSHFDYVIIARTPALSLAFSEILLDMKTAFKRLHAPPRPRGTSAQREQKGPSKR